MTTAVTTTHARSSGLVPLTHRQVDTTLRRRGTSQCGAAAGSSPSSLRQRLWTAARTASHHIWVISLRHIFALPLS